MNTCLRRLLMAVPIALALVLTAAEPALAQAYPQAQKTVRVILPGPPGSGADRAARLVADRLRELWGSPVIIENRPGAGGIAGSDYVAKAPPDGYTVLFAYTSVALSPTFLAVAPYDIEKDFEAVSMVGWAPLALGVRADSPARTLAEFVAAARSASSPVTYGTFGEGSIYHIYGETLRLAANANMTAIPYKGEALALTDMLGGQIQVVFGSVGLMAPQQRGGKVRLLAIVKPTRSNVIPDVPTFAELGYPQLDASGWLGLFLPRATPRAIVDKLSADVGTVLGQEAVIAALVVAGVEAAGTTPARFAEFLRAEGEKWRRMIQAAGIKPK